MTPHKGEEANQTVFVTNNVLESGLRLSDVPVPETSVIESPIKAFVMMSDGCEDGLWTKNRKEILPNGDFRYVPLNLPFEPALDDIIKRLSGCEEDREAEELFISLVSQYNRPLKYEMDDKTLCIGFKGTTEQK